MKEINLSLGQRLTITDDMDCIQVKKGNVEVYGVSVKPANFHQIYLMKRTAGEYIFPPHDEFSNTEFFVHALDDSILTQVNPMELGRDTLWQEEKKWFYDLVHLPWLLTLANYGDDILEKWLQPEFLSECRDCESLWKSFLENQNIFTMLLGVQFKGRDKKYTDQVESRELYKQYLLDMAVGNLLLEDEKRFIHLGRSSRQEEINIVVKHIAQNLHIPTDGVSIQPEILKKLDQISIIKRLVYKANMAMRLVKLSDNWHRADCGALIVYFGEKKVVSAAVPITENKYKLINRLYPDGIELTDDIASKIDRDAFQCYPGLPAKKLSMMDLFEFVFKRSWRKDYIAILLTSIVAGIIPVAIPIVTEIIFRDIIPTMDYNSLIAVAQIIFMTGIAYAGFGLVRSIAVIRITGRANMNLQAAMWNRLLQLPASFFRKHQSGEIMNRMAGINMIQSMLTGEFVGAVLGFIFSFWSIILMFIYSPALTLKAMMVWGSYLIIIAIIYSKVLAYQKKHIKAANKASGLIQQIFSGLPKFRVHGAEEQAFFLWSRVFGEEWRWNLKLRRLENYSGIINAVQPFILSIIIYYSASMSMSEAIAAGNPPPLSYPEFLAFQSAFSMFNVTVVSIVPLIIQMVKMKPHVDNLRPILETKPEITEEKVDARPLEGSLEISHVSFAYNEDDPDVLSDINIKINPKECVAIVGKSGCGKSTLMRLLLGMEKPKQGAIYYDGQDLSDLNLPSVRSQLGVVLQNGQLMSGDIFTNIAGVSSVTVDDAWEAAEKVGIASDIRRMPMGMYTPINENSSNISGGQKQRLMIARAISGNPAVLLLDEATSALDNRTQAIVTNSLDKIEATKIIVAHRLSTIRNADRIILIDKGAIAEQGTYDELMAKGGMFATLAQRQMM